jgi:hypothetical protein
MALNAAVSRRAAVPASAAASSSSSRRRSVVAAAGLTTASAPRAVRLRLRLDSIPASDGKKSVMGSQFCSVSEGKDDRRRGKRMKKKREAVDPSTFLARAPSDDTSSPFFLALSFFFFLPLLEPRTPTSAARGIGVLDIRSHSQKLISISLSQSTFFNSSDARPSPRRPLPRSTPPPPQPPPSSTSPPTSPSSSARPRSSTSTGSPTAPRAASRPSSKSWSRARRSRTASARQ